MTRAMRAGAVMLVVVSGCGDDGGGTGGQAGAAGKSGSSGQGGAGPYGDATCQPGKLAYRGTVDGQAVAFGAQASSSNLSMGGRWSLARHTPASQLFAFGQSAVPEQGSFAASEVLVQGGWPAAVGAWYCARDVSFARSSGPDGEAYTFAVPSLSRLGACPGVPVGGSIAACLDLAGTAACAGASLSLSGTVEQAALTTTSGVGASTSKLTDGVVAEFTFDGQGVLRVQSDGATTSGFLLMPNADQTGHILYCVGQGTAFKATDKMLSLTLSDVSRLGECADGTPAGSLDGCF